MRADLRKEQILECSKKIFAEKGGYYETYLEDVIKEAKIGKGTFYNHFKSKEELFISVLNKFLDEWEQYVSDSIETFDLDDHSGSIKIFIFKTFEFFQKNEQLCNIYLCNGPGLNPAFETSIKDFEDRMVNYIISLLNETISSGVLRKDLDLEFTANFFLGAFLRLAYYHFVIKRKKYTKKELHGLSDNFFTIAMSGIF